jgi:hypothetical protein
LDGDFEGIGVTYKPTDDDECVPEVWEFRKAMNHIMEKNRQHLLPNLLSVFSDSGTVQGRAMWDQISSETVWFNWVSVQWQTWVKSLAERNPDEWLQTVQKEANDATNAFLQAADAGHLADLAQKKATLEKDAFHKRVNDKMSGVRNSKLRSSGQRATEVSC